MVPLLIVGCVELRSVAVDEPKPGDTSVQVADTDALDTDSFDTALVVDTDVEQPTRTYDPSTTITVHLHGWILDGVVDDGNYGYLTSGGPLADAQRDYGGLPSYVSDVTDPSHVQGAHYYGVIPPDYLTESQVADLDLLEGVPRYAEIIALQARHALAQAPTATGINLTCHSMGCEVSRYIIENDVEELISDQLIKRWVTYAGVVAGAGLAKDLLWTGEFLAALGVDPIDIEHMTYTWFEENVAFDGQRQMGNNPNFEGIIIHHVLASKPTMEAGFLDVPLLDFNNPDKRPNDAIVWTEDEYLHHQPDEARLLVPGGRRLASTRTTVYTDHFGAREDAGGHLPGAAALVGSRRVCLVIDQVEVGSVSEAEPDVAVEWKVRWPWVEEEFGLDVVVDRKAVEHRDAEMAMIDGVLVGEPMFVHSAVVFDEMDELEVTFKAVEVDEYLAAGVDEGRGNDVLAVETLSVPLVDDQQVVNVGPVRLFLSLEVVNLY